MEALGLLVPVLVFGFIITISIVAGTAGQRRVNRLVNRGVPAKGLILGIASTGTSVVAGMQRYESRAMTLDVEIPGQAPFQIQCQGLIPKIMANSALPGVFVQLRVDPSNTSVVAVIGPGGVFFAG